MTPERFTDWLNGFFEIADPQTLDDREVKIIRDHLALVFRKVTPDRKEPIPDTVDFKFDPNRPLCDPIITDDKTLINLNGANSSNDVLFCSQLNADDQHDGVACSDTSNSNSTFNKPYVGPYTIK
jgi:hypothetical protein